MSSCQLKQLLKLVDLFVKHNSNAFVFDLNSFAKSQLFANINVFKLFDLPKSRLNQKYLDELLQWLKGSFNSIVVFDSQIKTNVLSAV